MLRAFLAALLVCWLQSCGQSTGVSTNHNSATRAGAPVKDEQPAAIGSINLTNEQSSASLELKQKLDQVPAVLEVSVTKVVNPEKTPVAVYVYLVAADKESREERDRIAIGNFSLYPPDQPGKFLMRASSAKEKVRSAEKESTSYSLVLELRRLHADKAWTPVELSITATWRNVAP